MKLLLFTGSLLAALAVGCQPLIVPVTPTPATTTISASATVTTPLTATATLMDTTATTVTVALSDTAAVQATLVITEPTTGAEPAAEPVANTPPSPETAQTTANTEPMLTVLVASLRIRSGPGTEYSVLGAVAQGEQVAIRGQAYECQWYQVAHPQFAEAWLAGGAQYVASDTSCDQVATVAIPTPPSPAPTVAPTATPVPPQAQQPSEPTPAPTEPPTAPPVQPPDDPFPADQGCLLLQNQLGPELTFTFTRADGSWSDIVKVNSDLDIPYCLAPGRYRVTVDAPPPWSSLNEEFTINAGDRAYYPIRPQQ
ncbi:MAG: SH3 domain-containing protein [Caldilineaceae bacterium]